MRQLLVTCNTDGSGILMELQEFSFWWASLNASELGWIVIDTMC
jgi:hypothetical protein